MFFDSIAGISSKHFMAVAELVLTLANYLTVRKTFLVTTNSAYLEEAEKSLDLELGSTLVFNSSY